MKKRKLQFWLNSIFLLFIFFFATFSFAAESTGDVPVDKEMKEKMRIEFMGDETSSNIDQEYIIGYRDILYVELYGEGPMSVGLGNPVSGSPNIDGKGDFVRGRGSGSEVRMDGRISLRHIGDVYVVGLTLTQLADYLKKLYSTIYENPSVTATLVQSNSRQYTMMGQVKMPGVSHLDFPLTIVKAIAKAGGFTEWANSDVTVIRQGSNIGDVGEKFEFDYDDFLKGKKLEENIVLQSGDIIVVH